MADLAIGAATPGDAAKAAELADAKRREYERYSPVFWRVADNAVDVHEPFLATCIADSARFASFAARRDGDLVGVAIAARKVGPPPFGQDDVPSWLLDDFYANEWSDVGGALLGAVEAAAAAAGAERLIVLAARRDAPKGDMLRAAGYARGASWWVRPVTPREAELPELGSTHAVTGPAPPVYDPGGLTALALRLPDTAEVTLFDEWASASNAVLAIVPVRSSEPELERALEAAGYAPASDWFVKRP